MSENRPDCCEHWKRAQESGTDNEGYGALLGYERTDAEIPVKVTGWYIGDRDELPPIKFCPWCGATSKGANPMSEPGRRKYGRGFVFVQKALLQEFYEVVKANPLAAEAINWEAFAKEAERVGLHYHPKLGLMTREAWEAIKDCVIEPDK